MLPRTLLAALLAGALCLLAPTPAQAGKPKGPAVTVTEGSAATVTIRYKVPKSLGKATVHYKTADGTAKAGADYTAVKGWVKFTRKQSVRTIVVPTSSDALVEGDETFVVNLKDSKKKKAAITVTIQDNTPPPPPADPCPAGATPTVSVPNQTVAEGGGTATLNVQLSAATPQQVTVHYATADHSAHSGTQYTTTSGDLTFAPCQTTRTIQVPIVDNAVVDGGDFFVALTNAVNATAGPDGTITITNNDPLKVVSASYTSVDHVTVVFNGPVSNATISAGATEFTFNPGNLTSTGRLQQNQTTIVVTTTGGTSGPYTMTVATTVGDIYGNHVDPGFNTASFSIP